MSATDAARITHRPVASQRSGLFGYMGTKEEMKMWRQVYVAAIRRGKDDHGARASADNALRFYKSEFSDRAGKGKG